METDAVQINDVAAPEWHERPSTCPNFTVSCLRYDQEVAQILGRGIGDTLRALGRLIDISTLDGVTVGYDYDHALAQLDRGYETRFVLERTNGVAIGVAMTPSVLRDGALKSHIVLAGHIADALIGDDDELRSMTIHTLAHECSHVKITAAWDRCFPGELLRARYSSVLEGWRSQVTSACWDEYAACRITADLGYDPAPGYAQTFLTVLSEIDGKVADLVSGFDGGNADTLVGPVLGVFGDLMKFGCYLQGTLAGTDRSLDDFPNVPEQLTASWYAPYFDRLATACDDIFAEFGQWPDKQKFEVISDILMEIVEEQVMQIEDHEDGSYRVAIHHRAANDWRITG
ncbi:hypothetical protein [Rhizobium leguminosarum]|uniref:hypothetical protein n=1 Tax=Rhizobium leguminosarum TaxID=384 RepID=UPI0014423B45|nr:hypothetical protein [Rhizobium leguminosarum]MBY5868473.1 hypothetical protein [Rhizobium leguminosarum]NKM07749.1 hypothetical protein [Rhizobium leguminosarum bv. viciae]